VTSPAVSMQVFRELKAARDAASEAAAYRPAGRSATGLWGRLEELARALVQQQGAEARAALLRAS